MTENSTRVLRKGKQFIAINTADTICGQGLSQNGEKTMMIVMTDNDVDDCDDDDFEDGD